MGFGGEGEARVTTIATGKFCPSRTARQFDYAAVYAKPKQEWLLTTGFSSDSKGVPYGKYCG